MRFFHHSILWLLLAATCCQGQRYPILPVLNSPHSIYVMMQDSKSRLWLGTIDDVYCFDGVNFYSIRQYGFPRETANAFGEDSLGGVWIATQGTDANGGTHAGGLYRYQAGRVEKVLSGDSLGVVGAGPGIVLASMGTELSGGPRYGDLYRIKETRGTWKADKLLDKTANHLTVDHRGNVLFPCPGGWCEVAQQDVGAWAGTPLPVTRHAGDRFSERVLRDRYGCVWSRTETRASYQCPGDAKPVYLSDHISQMDTSAHLEESSDGSVFMLVALVLGRPGAFHMTGAGGELPESLDSALIARDGTIWLGTDHGLFRFMYPFQLEFWPDETRLPDMGEFIRHIGDRVYSTSSLAGLTVLDQDRHHWSPIPNSSVWGLGEDAAALTNGNIVDVTADMTALIHPDGRLVTNSPGQGAYRLAKSADGQLWVGGPSGVARLKLEGNHLRLDREPVPADLVRDLQYDAAQDTLWACDGKKLIFRKNGAWRSLSTANGLLDQSCNTFAIEPDNTLWLGYGAPAYAVIHDPASDHPRVENFTGEIDTVSPSAGVHYFVSDKQGRLWRGMTALDVASAQNAEAGRWLRLDQNDGIGPLSAQGHPFYADNDASVWFATENGIVHFSPPPDFATNFPVPSVFLSGIALGNASPVLIDTLVNLPRNQDITAHIGSLQFDRRNALHFRYRLLPQQTAWTMTNNPKLSLHTPRWGKHTLEVQAQMMDGAWSTVQSASFSIARPMWASWPFLAGCVAFSGVVVTGGQKWRKERRKKTNKAFPEIGEWRLAALWPELHELDGTLLDKRFAVGNVLARGGFATVLEGRDLQQRSIPCAIKIFRQELRDKEWMAKRFRQEVLALATIRHPNVVRIFGHGTTPSGSPYLVMEFVDGQTLRSVLDETSLSPVLTAAYLRQIGSALDELHAHGVCHRDLKPENLMIRRESQPGTELVVIDFSIAIVKDPDETLHGLSRAAGTIYYMAPEQAIGYADASTDIYSLAKIVIEMLTGQRLSYLLPNASMDLPARVRELLSQLPVTLSSPSIELLSSALEFDPSRRPGVAGEFADRIAFDLESVRAGWYPE